MKERIGFIGLGIMGRGMAANLIKAGFNICVWNRTASRMEPLIELGARAAASPEDVASQSDIIILCVSDTADVEEVLFGEMGVSNRVLKNALVIDCSTISPVKTQAFAGQLNQKGVHFLDAPISGGSEGAEKGTLSIMVGGAPDQFQRALPVLEAMGQTITHVGAQGAGQMVKMTNQILCVVNMLGVSEAMLLAEAGGLDLEKMLAAVTGGAAGSWMLANRGPQVAEGYWKPGFTIDLQQKDLRLVLETADNLGVPLPATSLIFQMYRTLQAQGLGHEGNHALVKALENLAGIKIGND